MIDNFVSPGLPPAFANDEPTENRSSNAGKNSAAEQGSNIPMAWKPSAAEPVPVVRCTATAKGTGEQCKRWSLRGTNVCVKHGAQLPNVREHSEAVVETARMRIMGLADMAVDGLEELATTSKMDNVRLAAYKDLLDRAGVKGPAEVVEVQHTVSYADEVKNRLQSIRDRKKTLEAQAAEDAEDILDAEEIPAADNDHDDLPTAPWADAD